MYAIRKYNDLLIEIELNNIRIGKLKDEIFIIDKQMITPPSDIKAISYDGMPSGSKNFTSLDRLLESRGKCLKELEIELQLQDELKKAKKSMIGCIKKFEGIEYKVAYARMIEGKSFKTIALELNKNEQYLKNVYSKIKSQMP